MRVRELTIPNHRAFEGERTFALSDRVTVIAGVNGRGKTALLDGMALLIARLLRALGQSRTRRSRLESPANATQNATPDATPTQPTLEVMKGSGLMPRELRHGEPIGS